MASLGASSETARTVCGFPQVVGALALHRNFWRKRSAGAAVSVQPASATACREILVAAHDLPVVQHCHTHTLQRIERHILESESYWRGRSKWRSGVGVKLNSASLGLNCRGEPPALQISSIILEGYPANVCENGASCASMHHRMNCCFVLREACLGFYVLR